jgi:hypothetical protein
LQYVPQLIRILIRCLLFGIGMIFLGLSGFVLLSAKQVHKNQLEFADMKDRVAAVEKFESKNNRPPSKEELPSVLAGLPVRYSETQYKFASTPDYCPIKVPGGWPNTSGWILYFWRGEWYEYYTSWNKHYTLAEQATWWGFCGPMLFCPVAAVLFIGLSFLPVLKRRAF